MPVSSAISDLKKYHNLLTESLKVKTACVRMHAYVGA